MPTEETIRAEVGAWLDENWDPELTLGEWWRRVADARYGMPGLPEPWGRDYDRQSVRAVRAVFRERRVLGPPGGVGNSLTLPTVLAHGTPEQIERYVPGILDGSEGWCQLFSEPGAGSDLAGLQTRAERDGDEWIVNGQKVWTSTGQYADYGILIARTDPELPKHQGITFFLFPMLQPGVDVRPLREMTGEAVFNEVFLDNARVPHANVLGGVNHGWTVANTTLTHERAGIGDADAGWGRAAAGTVAGHLTRKVGEIQARRVSSGLGGGVGPGTLHRLIELARSQGCIDDPLVRQGLARLHSKVQLVQMTNWRLKAAPNTRTGGEGNLAKLRMTDLVEEARDTGNLIAGAHGQLWGPDTLTDGWLQGMTVFSPAPPIYGGTDQVQRNIIGERVLGLPKEPGPDRDTPFRDLLANAIR